MSKEIPAEVTRRFHNSKARPVVVQEYHAYHGWERAHGHRVITEDVVEDLLDRGVSMVTVRWHFVRHDFPLSVLKAQKATPQVPALPRIQPTISPTLDEWAVSEDTLPRAEARRERARTSRRRRRSA